MSEFLALAQGALLLVSSVVEVALVVALYLVFRRYRATSREHRALLKEKEVVFHFVHDVADVFAESDGVDIEALVSKVLSYAMRTSRAGAGAIYLFEPGDEVLRARAVTGVFPPLDAVVDAGLERAVSRSQQLEQLVRSRTIAKGAGLVGQVAQFGAPLLVEDAERDPRVPRYDVDFLRIGSLLAVPMRFRRRVMGVLVLVNRIDGQAFIASDADLLQGLADQASVSLHYAVLREDLDAKKRLDRDLALAREIQNLLLPRRMPEVPGLDLAGFSVPALEIGGDYYDFIPVDDRHLGIAIADVSGKGVGGAMLMSVCRTVLRASAPGCLSPAEAIRRVARLVRPDLAEDMFITALYAVLDLDTRRLTLVRAGHERAVLCRHRDRSVSRIDATGVAIGMADDATFDAALREVSVDLEPGDLLGLFTDGVSEAMNAQGEEWGVDRLSEALQTTAADGASEAIEAVRRRLMRFVGDSPSYDDMTLVAVRVKP